MIIRTARPGDETGINLLYDQAKASMRALGIDQWQRGLPSAETAAADIAAGVSRVAVEGERIVASYTFVPGGEEDYRSIRGKWLTDGDSYAAMHRVVVATDLRGGSVTPALLRQIFAEARARRFPSVRVDTHPGNIPMRRMLEKNGFSYCGEIHLIGGPDDGALRVAYEKLVPECGKMYDITQELFSSVVYPGDLAPTPERVKQIARGDVVNLTNLSMCAHNGTHMDAPLHFIDGAPAIPALPLTQCIGAADVIDCGEIFDAAAVQALLPPGCRRVLLRGGTPDLSGARALVEAGIVLIGVEPQSVGDMYVHRTLLGANIAVLEGIRLTGVPAGRYRLTAAPLLLAETEGSPVRAVLEEM